MDSLDLAHGYMGHKFRIALRAVEDRAQRAEQRADMAEQRVLELEAEIEELKRSNGSRPPMEVNRGDYQ